MLPDPLLILILLGVIVPVVVTFEVEGVKVILVAVSPLTKLLTVI